jgi:nucleoside-diphosphate-sugar epimerase
VATLVCAAAEADQSLVELADPPEGYALLIESLDTERLRSLGWRPRVPLEDGIRSTLDWLREAA